MDSNKINNQIKNMKLLSSTKLICCKLYISESRNSAALDAIERASKVDPESVLVNKFQDRVYNRVRYTLVSYVVNDGNDMIAYSPLRRTLHGMVESAYAAINLELHSGAHPRLGVVDHICFHPLAMATLDDAARVAKIVASDIGNGCQVPVFLYEAAHPTGKPLDTIRRELGYFRPNIDGIQWSGSWPLPDILPFSPDEGPDHVSPSRGVAVVGASPWVENYNVPVLSTDVPSVRRIARMVSARGGGLPTVQALGLVHGDGCTEIACILLDPLHVGAEQVQQRVEDIAAEEGMEVEKGYFTEISQDMIIERYFKLVISAK